MFGRAILDKLPDCIKNHKGGLSPKIAWTNMWLLLNHTKLTLWIETSNYKSSSRQLKENSVNGSAMLITINRVINLRGHSQIQNSILNIDPTPKSWLSPS